MADLNLVTYCGLYCGLCSQKCRTPKQARQLQETMKKDGYDYWGQHIPGFNEFWKFLGNLAESNDNSCRAGTCGSPLCSIRKCAREKNIEACAFCKEFPCQRVQSIAKGYPTLVADMERMKKIGMDAWIEEQKKRAETGFAYVDIRCYPYEVPTD